MLDANEAMQNLTFPPKILTKEDFASQYDLLSLGLNPYYIVEMKKVVKDAKVEALWRKLVGP